MNMTIELRERLDKFHWEAQRHARRQQLVDDDYLQKFAELIVKECAKLNKEQSYELLGVIVDTDGGEYDTVCSNTVQRVHSYLATDGLLRHFGLNDE